MNKATGIILCSAAISLASAAHGDVAVTVGIKGYNDFFKRCDLQIEYKADNGADEVSILYRVLVDGVGGAMCEQFSNGSGCRSSDDFKPTCEQISSVDVLHAKCADGNGDLFSCGSVKARAGSGMSAPVNALPAPAAVDGTSLFASLLGGPDYSGRCAVGMLYAAPEAIKQVKVEYEIPVAGGTARCTLNMGGASGTGRSCLGADEFDCGAVQTVNVTSVVCETEDGETDCGPVHLHGAEAGLFVDAR